MHFQLIAAGEKPYNLVFISAEFPAAHRNDFRTLEVARVFASWSYFKTVGKARCFDLFGWGCTLNPSFDSNYPFHT